MKKLLHKKAYTLAEVLVTLVIVGTISALTVPSLKNHADEAKYVAATQKAMSEIAAATSNAELVYGDASNWKFNSSTTVNYYKKAMNIVAIPKGSKTSWTRYRLDGTNGGEIRPNFMTADGMAWMIHDGGYGCGGGCALVDVNGSAPPNTIGLDIQGFRIGHRCDGEKKTGDFGVYAMGDGKNDTNSEWACTAYIIRHKKMPWLKKPPAEACKPYVGK